MCWNARTGPACYYVTVNGLSLWLILSKMLIQHREGKVKSLFYVEQEGKILAEMVYSTPNPGQMLIEHTEVDESLSGKESANNWCMRL
jgi:hypothetical protein